MRPDEGASAVWPQAAGPSADWKAQDGRAPARWSVVQDQNILWQTTLPEGGQSAVTVWQDKAFVTTYRPIQPGDALDAVKDIVGYCLDTADGSILWTVDLPGSAALGSAGAFSDSTVFAPVTDGEHVWFFNRSGSIGCFDMHGEQVWMQRYTPRQRHSNRQCEPILFQGKLLVVEVLDKQVAKSVRRHADLEAGIDPRKVWTYLHCRDASTGETLWAEPVGTVVHNTPMFGRCASGEPAVLHARGGPHKALEKPYGLSLTSLAPVREGGTIWSVEIADINTLVNNHWDAQRAYAFAGPHHLVLDSATGREISRQHLREGVDVWSRESGDTDWRLKRGIDLPGKKPRLLTYHTNIVVGDFHYFLSHDRNAIGRVDVVSGRVTYLAVPIQAVVGADGRRKEVWDNAEVIRNEPKNARGMSLMDDKRSAGTGWGHISAASPVLVGRYLYFPVMTGTVYVIDTQVRDFSGKALVAVNDLGPAGQTWTLASLSYAGGKLYARTATGVICIGEQ